MTKVERKGRTKAELDRVIHWLTGFDEPTLGGHLAAGTTFEDFFAEARVNPHATLITGVVCGVRVENAPGEPAGHDREGRFIASSSYLKPKRVLSASSSAMSGDGRVSLNLSNHSWICGISAAHSLVET